MQTPQSVPTKEQKPLPGIYDDDEGQRAAISSLLDLAEAMNIPGELTFAEADSFIWMTMMKHMPVNFASG